MDKTLEEILEELREQGYDVISPVRCKDCIRKSYSDGFAECYFLGIITPDDYCSNGKRGKE